MTDRRQSLLATGSAASRWTFLAAAVVGFLFLAGVLVLLYLQNQALTAQNYERAAIAPYQLRHHYAQTKVELIRLADGRSDADLGRAVLSYDIFYGRLLSLPKRPPYDVHLSRPLLREYERIRDAFLPSDVPFQALRQGGTAAEIRENASAVLSAMGDLDQDIGMLAARLNQQMAESRQNAQDELLSTLHLLFVLALGFVISAGTVVGLHFRHLSNLASANRDLIQLSEDLMRAREQADMANRAKSEFLAGMSHELRTPLNAIIGFSDMIRNNYAGTVGERVRDYADDIHMSGVHLLSLVNSILDTSRIEQGALELEDIQFELGPVIEEVLEMMSISIARKHLEQERPPANAPMMRVWLNADRNALKQMLINLFANAVKFTPQHGKIGLTIEDAPSGGLSITVWDTGIGIPAEDLPRIQNAFERGRNRQTAGPETAAAEGVGLGLSITKALIERQQGTLTLESTEGEGTRATLTYPPRRRIDAPQRAASRA